MAHEEVGESAGPVIARVVHGADGGHGEAQTGQRHRIDAVTEAVLTVRRGRGGSQTVRPRLDSGTG